MSDGRADDGAGKSREMGFVCCCEHRNVLFPRTGRCFFS